MGIKLLVPVIVSILILGSLGMDQQSYGQVETSTFFGGDQNPPESREKDCSLTFLFFNLPSTTIGSIIHGGTCTAGPLNPDYPLVGDNTPLAEYKPSLPAPVNIQDIPANQAVHLMLPNFIDEFDTKKVRIQVLYDTRTGFTPSVKFPGGVKEDVNPGIPEVNPEICFRNGPPTFGSAGPDEGYFFEDWTCHPNPVNEVIWFDISGALVKEIVVDTISFGEPKFVGGEMINVDSAALILAGSQMTAAWILPVLVAGAGFAIVIARKF